METCYMCEAPANSREHVPPKCIFPKSPKARKNLVTVPSCDIHNLTKSRDDELVRHVLACAPGNNEVALEIVESVLRSFDRRPHIIETFLSGLTLIDDTAGFSIDRPRFEQSICAIARGLHFHITGKKLLEELRLAWTPLRTKNFSEAPYFGIVERGESLLLPMRFGENKEVFQYDFHDSNDLKVGLCRLRFYGGHPIYLTWNRT